jgi:paraquat-inducible protein B
VPQIERTRSPEALDVPEARVLPPKRRRVQLVWIIPAIAVLIGAWLTVKSYLEVGPTINIRFRNAEGIEAGKTKIRYKSVDIGEVKNVDLDTGNRGVVVRAQMSRGATRLLVKDTRFWVVRARIAGGQISGLGTLLSGSYIGVDAGKSAESRREFDGLDVPPTVTADEPGREFELRGSALGSIDIGSPVYHRQVPVGRVTSTGIAPDGSAVAVKIFISSPYENFVTEKTRFWHASGIDVSLDASGFKVRTQSLLSIALGGIAFREPPEARGASKPARPGAVFTLFPEETSAMKRLDTEVTPFVSYFVESVRGLSPGAPIDFRGIVIGEVKSIDLQFDPETKSFRFPVEIDLYADRLRPKDPKYETGTFDGRDLIQRLIRRGLRAQLRSGNLLTGQTYIALDFFPQSVTQGKSGKLGRIARARPDARGRSEGDAKADANDNPEGSASADVAAIGNGATDLPEMPTVIGSLEDLQVTIGNIAKKIDKLPFDEIAAELRRTLKTLQVTMDTAERFIGRLDRDVAPNLNAAMIDARKTMAAAQKVLASDAPVQQDVRGALRELGRAAQSLRVLTDYLQQHPQSLIFGKSKDAAGADTGKAEAAGSGVGK